MITFSKSYSKSSGGHGSSVVSESDLKVESSNPGRYTFSSWAKHLTLTVPLSTQVYKWKLTSKLLWGGPDKMLGDNL